MAEMYTQVYFAGKMRKITYEKEGNRLKASIEVGQEKISGYSPVGETTKFSAYQVLTGMLSKRDVKKR